MVTDLSLKRTMKTMIHSSWKYVIDHILHFLVLLQTLIGLAKIYCKLLFIQLIGEISALKWPLVQRSIPTDFKNNYQVNLT